MEYRAKGDENTTNDRPPARGGGEGRGRGRGNRGRGAKRGDFQASKEEGQHTTDTERQSKPKQQEERKQMGEWQAKYRADFDVRTGRRTKGGEKFELKEGEEIPQLPEEILKKPVKDALHKALDKQDVLIQQFKDSKFNLIQKRKQVFEGGKVQGSEGNVTYKDCLTVNFSDVKALREEKNKSFSDLNKIKDAERGLQNEKQIILKEVPRNYQNEDDVQSAIKKKEKEYETGSRLSSQEEKKLLIEIEILKKALPDMKRLALIDPQLNKYRAEKKVISQKLDEVQRKINVLDKQIDETKAASQSTRMAQDEVREKADQISLSVDEAHEKMREAYDTKDSMRESYYKQLFEFEVQNEKIRWIKGLRSGMKQKESHKKEKEMRINQKRLDMQNRSNPYEHEIETCEQLINYCKTLKHQHGLMPQTSEEVAKKAETELINEYNRNDIEQKMKDGKIQAVQKDSDAGAMQIGGGKGKKGKKPKPQNKQSDMPKAFQLEFTMTNKFGIVQVSPPTAASHLDIKINELTEKMNMFVRDGSSTLKKDQSEVEKNIEKLVEDEMAQEQNQADNEEEKEDDGERRHSHRGRGGFTKAYGGRPRQEKDTMFDADSEEDKPADRGAYSKPNHGGGHRGGKGRGGRPNMKNDEDFPTL